MDYYILYFTPKQAFLHRIISRLCKKTVFGYIIPSFSTRFARHNTLLWEFHLLCYILFDKSSECIYTYHVYKNIAVTER